MEFQFLSASIEDKLPPAMAEEADIDDISDPSFLESASQIEAQLFFDRTSPVVCLFGRRANGESICVRVEGFRPKLYFFPLPGESVNDIVREMTQEIRHDGVPLKGALKTFTHFNGYEPDETAPSQRKCHDYVEVQYPSVRSWRRAISVRKDDETGRYRTAHESNVDVMTSFLRSSGICSGGWVGVEHFKVVDFCISSCDVELACHVSTLKHVSSMEMSPYVIMNYDAETLSLDPKQGAIIQLSMVFETRESVKQHCVVIGDCDDVEGSNIHVCHNEYDFLLKVREIIVRENPDFMVSYNGVNFDNPFLHIRCDKAGAQDVFPYFSRFVFRPCRFRELQLQSSGMGDNLYKYFDAPGRVNVDYFVVFKVNFPSEVSWSLKHFCEKFLPGENKEDVTPKEIPILQAGSSADRQRLAIYCIKDSFLLRRLNQVRNIIVVIIQFANVFGILPEHVYLRGQQIRFISQILDAARTMEEVPLLLQTPKGGFVGANDHSGFKGATVNEPLSGYYKEPVGTLDWASLYPSIMTGYNLCHSTHVRNQQLQHLEGVQAHRVRKLGCKWKDVSHPPANVVLIDDPQLKQEIRRNRQRAISETSAIDKSIESFELEYDIEGDFPMPELSHEFAIQIDDKTWSMPTGDHTTYFTKQKKGILPRILENLLSQRSASKKGVKEHTKKAKEMKANGVSIDDATYKYHLSMASVFDGRQLALKVSANSMYGACGAGVSGKMPNKDISETVTFQGRETMVVLIEILPIKFPNLQIIYGDTDSVMIKFVGVLDLDECAKLCHEAADFVTAFFAKRGLHSMVLEFEKIFFPFILLRKKRYLALKYEPTDDGTMECKGVDAKGVETERKDTLPFLKAMYCKIREDLLYHMDEYKALETMRECLVQMVNNEIPFGEYILSKGLRSDYKDPSTQVQWCVNEKKRKRQEGSQTAVGDRVWYVIINGPLNAKATELAEDPTHVLENGLKLNRLWYFDHKVKTPMESLFSVIKTVDVKALLQKTTAELKRERLGISCVSAGLRPKEEFEEEQIEVSTHVPREPPPPIRKKGGARKK